VGKMSNLNLQNLKDYRDEILKAEIGALLFNLGKTHIGLKNNKKYFDIDEQLFEQKFGYDVFGRYKEYYQDKNNQSTQPFKTDLDKFTNLRDFILGQNQKVNFPFEVVTNNQPKAKEILWQEFFKGDSSEVEFIQKVFFRGCENINSGIDKGNPVEQLKPPLWLSNAFGSFKHKIEEKDFDDARIEFFRDFDNFLQCNNFYQSPNWQKIRKFIFERVKSWYSKLLSDRRYPVNDVSLWDQAYMTASMFKAVLSNLVLDNSNLQNFQNNPSSIKWRILGIQYDKLGLAEKGLKPAHIDWYRNISKEIDDEIKKLLEYEYPIGNEVYRDETGVYFIVGDDLGEKNEEDEGYLAILKSDLNEIKEEILKIFKEKSIDEFYPAIFLTKASRGLMNLAYLLENASGNFLNSDWSKKELDICLEKSLNGRARGICQVCKQRLVFESDEKDKNKNICDVCYEKKTKGRMDEWLNNRAGKTIWTSELRDKNDRLALVVMKFELMDWLNGYLLSSELIRCLDSKNYNDYFYEIKDVLKYIKEELSKDEIKKLIEIDNNLESKIRKFLNLYDKAGIYEPFEEIYDKLKQNKNIENIKEENGYRDLAKRLLSDDEILEHYKFFDAQQNIIVVNKIQNKTFPKDTYITNDAAKDHLYKIFTINYLLSQIYNTLLERSIGDKWEEFIKNKLKNKIDFENRKIEWQKLDDNDDNNINFLSTLLLQFLLRKNPSPARLRRIWESTQEFFEEIEEKLLCVANIPDERRKRYYWEKNKISGNIDKEEYYDGEAEFLADNSNVYLISYLKDNGKKNFRLKKITDGGYADTGIELKLQDAKIEYYKPYISIIDPTPISWQFIIPAEYIPELIKNTQNLYDEYFKYVYGKLPLHIGVIIQDYKKPLYVGINALRKIRRDVKDRGKLWEEIEVKDSKKIFNDKIKKGKIEEQCNNPVEYYSLYFGGLSNGDYKFYITPKDKTYWLKNVNYLQDNEKIKYIPNTFDFEFLDTNTRRNDIYYNEHNHYKRKADLKTNKPYNIEKHFDIFEKFKEAFKEGSSTSKLHNIINIFYEKAILKEDLDDGTKKFLASVIINTLEPRKSEKVKNFIQSWLGFGNKDITHQEVENSVTKEKIKMFIDIFDFWHKALKEV